MSKTEILDKNQVVGLLDKVTPAYHSELSSHQSIIN